MSSPRVHQGDPGFKPCFDRISECCLEVDLTPEARLCIPWSLLEARPKQSAETPCIPQCTSIKGLMISIRWYLGFLEGQLGVLVSGIVYEASSKRTAGRIKLVLRRVFAPWNRPRMQGLRQRIRTNNSSHRPLDVLRPISGTNVQPSLEGFCRPADAVLESLPSTSQSVAADTNPPVSFQPQT